MPVSNPVKLPAATQAYLIFLIALCLRDRVEKKNDTPRAISHGSCIFSFQFQSNFRGMFDLMWALGSQRVWGQRVAIRAASHERTSNIWAQRACRILMRKDKRIRVRTSLSDSSMPKHFIVWDVVTGFLFFFFFCQALKIKDEVTSSSLQEWSKLVGITKNKHNSVSSILKQRKKDPRKIFNEIQKEAAFFLILSLFFYTFLVPSERAASELASEDKERARDTWKRLGFMYCFKKETCSAGFIGL